MVGVDEEGGGTGHVRDAVGARQVGLDAVDSSLRDLLRQQTLTQRRELPLDDQRPCVLRAANVRLVHPQRRQLPHDGRIDGEVGPAWLGSRPASCGRAGRRVVGTSHGICSELQWVEHTVTPPPPHIQLGSGGRP